jgi:hypothetical protein
MMRRIFLLILAGALLGLVAAPAQSTGGGSVYEQDHYDEPYTFKDDGCGFVFKVKGRRWGHFVIRNVPGSDGQAFLNDEEYNIEEVLTNPRNGKRMYISRHGHYTEKTATHVEGDVWEFIQVDQGRPFTVRNGRRQIVLSDHGKVVFKQVFDTLGDGQPGGDEISRDVVRTPRGSFPSLKPGFDFCKMVRKLIG